jgi:hypothetical protein
VADHPGLRQLLTNLATDRVDQLTVAATLLTAIGLWALGHARVVSPKPLWLWSVTLLAGLVVTLAGRIRWQTHPSNALAHVRIAVGVAVITVIIYLTGWGPILGIGYIVIVRDLTTQMGSRHWRALTAWSALGFTGGALAIAAGLAPTMLSRPSVYGLAALAGAATIFAIVLLGISGEHAESAQQSLIESEHKLRRTIETANEAYRGRWPNGRHHGMERPGRADLRVDPRRGDRPPLLRPGLPRLATGRVRAQVGVGTRRGSAGRGQKADRRDLPAP